MYRSAVQPKPPSSSLAVTPSPGHRPFGPPTCRSAPGRTAYRQPSWSSSAPSTHKPERVHFTPVCLTGYVPSSGFLTLSTGYSSPRRPTLFQAGSAHGVPLFRGFPPLPGPADSSSHGIALVALFPLMPSLGLRARGVCRRCLELAQTYYRLQGFAPAVDPYRIQASIRAALRPIPS